MSNSIRGHNDDSVGHANSILQSRLRSKSDPRDCRNLMLNLQPFFGAIGCTTAIVLTALGAAYGTAKAGVGVCSMGVLRPDLIVKSKLNLGFPFLRDVFHW